MHHHHTIRRDLERTVPPAEHALTLVEAKRQLQIPDGETAFDAELVETVIPSAIERVETDSSRALVTQTWVLTLARFPHEIELRRPPVQEVEAVEYLDAAGDLQTLDPEEYQTRFPKDGPGLIRPRSHVSWPSTLAGAYDAVRVTFVAGYGDLPHDVPPLARDAVKIAVEEMHRGCDYEETYWSLVRRIAWGGGLYG